MAATSQRPTGTPSPAPEGFFKELDDRATATGVHAGAEMDGSQISIWFKGDPGSEFREWAQAQHLHGQVIVIHVDAAHTKVETLAAMDRLTRAGYFEPGKPPMPEVMSPDQRGRGVVLKTDNYTPAAQMQADLERVAGMPVMIRFGKLHTLGP